MKNEQDNDVTVPLVHFHKSSHSKKTSHQQTGAYTMPHPVWSRKNYTLTHTPPEKTVDKEYLTC